MTHPHGGHDALSAAHAVSRILHESVFYPPHAPRTASAGYTREHKRLTHELDLPCQVCGVRNSTLADPELNKFHAKAIETHHHVIEWALSNAIDLDKFNTRIVERHKANPHHDPIYDQPFTQQQMCDWIDHHPDNLWILCDVHHRHTLAGVHAVTYPIWGVQDLLRDDFKYLPDSVTEEAQHVASLMQPQPNEHQH